MGDLDSDREGDAWMETDRGEGCVAVFAIVVGLAEQVEKLSVVLSAHTMSPTWVQIASASFERGMSMALAICTRVTFRNRLMMLAASERM